MPTSVPHGDIDYGELNKLGLTPHDIIDFSANSNPFGPHPAVLEAIRAAVTVPKLRHYPDRHCLELRQAIAMAEDIDPHFILPTNGANELIQMVALAFIKPGSRHLILSPTFGEYERAIRVMGGHVQPYFAAGSNYRHDIAHVATVIRETQPATVWLCNPNNPTGQYLTPAEIAELRSSAQPETLWIVDESYQYFSAFEESLSRPAIARDHDENIIVMRSLTKEHGLAGLRLGFAIATPERIEQLRVTQPAWSVNSLAQVAGVAALQPDVQAEQRRNIRQLLSYAAALWAELGDIGLRVLPTNTSYTLIETGQAAPTRRALLNSRLLVRDCSSFGLPQHIRVAAQLPEQNRRLIEALSRLSKSL
ncbi:MAG: histidinol-phosphate aminotransferase family protein [Anaerolineae bacterium]|nr:histidinol-phosphate aminotransferase family protein [Anaerolineae bacterium]